MKLFLATFVALIGGAAMADDLRIPLALELMENRETLIVGCKDGTLASIDTKLGRVRQMLEIGGSITDVKKVSDTELLATNFENGEVLRLQIRQGRAEIAERKKVGDFPVSLSVDPWKKRAYIIDKWRQRVISVRFSPTLELQGSCQLPFIPREQLLLANGKQLLVADAQGGNLAVLNADTLEIRSIRQLPAHNIRGLALNPDGDRIFISHQRLNPLARTTFDDIHWGMTMSNVVREIPVSAVLNPKTNLVDESRIWNLGTTGNGAGDPDDLSFLESDEIVIAVGGTGQIFWGKFGDTAPTRIATGARPTALAIDEFSERIYVSNSLEDRISVLDFDRKKVVGSIEIARKDLMISAAGRGQQLFFNARLSHDGWMSCHSCHTNGHTNEQLADTFGDRSFGTAKRIPSLLGRAQTAPFGWLGNKANLESQIEATLESTMHHNGGGFTAQQVEDLVAFLKSLPSPPRFEVTSAANRGKLLFRELNCVRCHSGTAFTRNDAFEVGVRDEDGNTEFNPPSLLGIRYQRSFFHDGRFTSLESIFTEGNHQLDRPLTSNQLRDLTEYLRSL
ncbi:MAG: cytochrome c peroxidase [Verrucomicrobiota bacterium]